MYLLRLRCIFDTDSSRVNNHEHKNLILIEKEEILLGFLFRLMNNSYYHHLFFVISIGIENFYY